MPPVIDFFCTQCGKRIGLPERPAGGQAQCPLCKAVVLVPAAGAPAAWPAGQGGAEAYWIGDQLVVPRGTTLPRTACSICAGRENVDLIARTFTWCPPYAMLIGVVGMLLMQKREVVGIPLCAPCSRRWKLSSWGAPLLMVAGIFVFPIAGGLVGSLIGSDEAIAIGVLVGFVAWIASLVYIRFGWIGKRTLICKHIDQTGVHLALPNAKAIQGAWTRGG